MIYRVMRILLLVFVLSSCTNTAYLEADLGQISRSQDKILIQSSTNAQEQSFTESDQVKTNDLSYQVVNQALEFTLNSNTSGIRFKPTVLGLREDWMEFSSLHLEFANNSSEDIKIAIVLWSHRGRLSDTLIVNGQSAAKKEIDLQDLPLIGRGISKYHVDEIQFLFTSQVSPSNMVLNEMKLEKRAGPPTPVIDRYGQRISTEWSGKIKSDEQLTQNLVVERNELKSRFHADKYDQYFGLKIGTTYQATGYFRLEQLNDSSWIFITPDGNPFWSFGVTGIRPKKALHGVTLIKGNEQLFEELPDMNGPYKDAYIDSTMSFYYLNLLKKYESLDGWRNMVYSRLEGWGLNTMGNWSEEALLMDSKIPFTYSFISDVDDWQKDVYHPGWLAHLESVISHATNYKDNPYLVGYFVDNEAGWGHLRLLQNLPKDAYLRKAWVKEIQRDISTIELYNKSRGTDFSSWEELMKVRDEKDVPPSDIMFLDSMFTDKYFGAIAATLKKYDPHHLYLGCRFTRKLKPDHILRIAGRYCDVVTVNVYSYEPITEQMDAWHTITGRPILIGEHQAALKGPRQLPLRWQVFTEAERVQYFKNYVKKWASMPYSLGSHWYQFSDQHNTGRASNGENQLVGFVDITDQPHAEMVSTAKEISDSIYYWHRVIQNTK